MIGEIDWKGDMTEPAGVIKMLYLLTSYWFHCWMYLNTGSTLPIRAICKLYPKIFKAQDFYITSRNYSLILLSLANYFHYNIICSYFYKDNQSTHIKILLISKCSHLFWEVLLLDKSFFFFPPLMINTVFYKVKKKICYSKGIQCNEKQVFVLMCLHL